jgi:hypothetical protein
MGRSLNSMRCFEEINRLLTYEVDSGKGKIEHSGVKPGVVPCAQSVVDRAVSSPTTMAFRQPTFLGSRPPLARITQIAGINLRHPGKVRPCMFRMITTVLDNGNCMQHIDRYCISLELKIPPYRKKGNYIMIENHRLMQVE